MKNIHLAIILLSILFRYLFIPSFLPSFLHSFLHSVLTDKTEPHPALQAVVATLSTGPVAASDKLGYTNVSLLMRSVASLQLNRYPGFFTE